MPVPSRAWSGVKTDLPLSSSQVCQWAPRASLGGDSARVGSSPGERDTRTAVEGKSRRSGGLDWGLVRALGRVEKEADS